MQSFIEAPESRNYFMKNAPGNIQFHKCKERSTQRVGYDISESFVLFKFRNHFIQGFLSKMR